MSQVGTRRRKPNVRVTTLVLEGLSRSLNRSIRFDENTQYQLRQLGACVIGFKLRGSELGVLACISDGEVALTNDATVRPDVQIEGGVGDFIAMARTQRDGSTLAAGKIDIQGDLAIAQHIQRIIAEASIDFEELLAARVGDVVARQIGRGVRGGLGWVANTRTILERDVSEYLLYEMRMLPTTDEVERFIASGAKLAAGTERLQARVARLRRLREHE